MPVGGTATLDLLLQVVGKASVSVALFTRYIGGEWVGPLDVDWRVAVHYQLKATSDRGDTSNWQYPLQLTAVPGDVVEVCADGVEAGLPKACER